MPEQYKGFRIWNLEFQAMKYVEGSSDVTIELDSNNQPTGRLLGTNDAVYWSEDDVGLACHLRDFLKPMYDGTNGVGWSLDTDLYSELYDLVASGDSSFQPFIDRNPDVYHPTLNPNGEKTVKLVPTSFVRAMFFKHTNGYKAMIGLSMYAMDANHSFTTNGLHEDSFYIKTDPGFDARHILFELYEGSYLYVNKLLTGGLFISLIPPPNNLEDEERFHPEYSILDENFFAPIATKIVPMIRSLSNSNSSSAGNYSACSWLKTGTSTLHSSTTSGVLVGTNMKLSLMLDTKANVGLSYKYTAGSNTTYINPVVFIGPLFNRKLSSSDTLCTKYVSAIVKNIGQVSLSSTSLYSYFNSAWYSAYGSTYYTDGHYVCYSSSYTSVYGFNEDASNMNGWLIYTAYPALDSSVYTNYRYAKSGYTTNGFLDESVIRWSASDGLVAGQTYNDYQWCFLGNNYVPYAQNGTTSSTYMYPSIRWDGEFNGTKTFV